jgi:hypothetical protein
MEQLGIYPLLANASWVQVPNNPTNITLHQFENAVASMTAMIYWTGTHMHSEDDHVNVLIQCRQRPIMGLIPGFKIW